jgi:YfiH family protein
MKPATVPARKCGDPDAGGGPAILRCGALESLGGCIAAFSTRRGGVSAPPFRALNLGFHVGDDPRHVLENRARVARTLGIAVEDLVVPEGVHGARVAVVDAADRGRGARSAGDAIRGVDALVTRAEGVALGGLTGDCPILLLYDARTHAAGMAHASWRGVAGNIPGATVRAMRAAFGTRPEDLRAAISPSIGPCCFAVQDDFLAEVAAALDPEPFLSRRNGRLHFDLWGAIGFLLAAEAVAPTRVTPAPACSCCNPDLFFSHRRDGRPTGRSLGVIRLSGP